MTGKTHTKTHKQKQKQSYALTFCHCVDFTAFTLNLKVSLISFLPNIELEIAQLIILYLNPDICFDT